MPFFRDVAADVVTAAQSAARNELEIPDTARKLGESGHRWMDVVDILGADAADMDKDDNGDISTQFSIEFSFNAEGTGKNVGTRRTIKYYINNDAMKRGNSEEWPFKKSRITIAMLSQILQAAGIMAEGDDLTAELQESCFSGFESPLVGRRVWAEITQRPARMEVPKGSGNWVDNPDAPLRLEVKKWLAQ